MSRVVDYEQRSTILPGVVTFDLSVIPPKRLIMLDLSNIVYMIREQH